jgi:hypothetical protein
MTTQVEDRAVAQPLEYDPFPQPQTIPASWDVSVFISKIDDTGNAKTGSELNPG